MTSRATSFGRRAEDYDRVRPEYPPAAVDLVVSRLGLGTEAVVLDLGAGTGKLTRPLVERFHRVIAVEPDPGMRAVLTRATEAYRVLDGRAEAIPLDDRRWTPSSSARRSTGSTPSPRSGRSHAFFAPAAGWA